MNDDDQDDEVVDGIISEAVAQVVEPLAERRDAVDRRSHVGITTVMCNARCTCGHLVTGRSVEAMIAGYRDHTLFAHGLIQLVMVQ